MQDEPEKEPAPEAAPPPEKKLTWREKLLAAGEIERHEGLLAILGEDQPAFLATLPRLGAAERHQVIVALWQQVDVLLLEGRERSPAVFAAARAQSEDPELREAWGRLAAFFRPATPAASLDPEEVRAGLLGCAEPWRRSFARALLIHPSAAVRSVARAGLEPADFHFVITSRSTSFRLLLELWQSARGRAPEDFFKIFLFAVAGRLLSAHKPDQLGYALELWRSFLGIGAFRERACRQLVFRIEEHLRAEASRLGHDLSQDADHAARLQAFAGESIAIEQPIQIWSTVPLPVQRELARRGIWPRTFACHPVDAIAAECFPHLMNRGEIVEILKIQNLNQRLLGLLAEEKPLYESDAAKFQLLAHPRCPYHIIGKYIGYLTSESLTRLAQGYLFNTFARKQAERLLAQRGKAKK